MKFNVRDVVRVVDNMQSYTRLPESWWNSVNEEVRYEYMIEYAYDMLPTNEGVYTICYIFDKEHIGIQSVLSRQLFIIHPRGLKLHVNTKERKKMILAMEYIARQINDESVFASWLGLGVADGDIPYGSMCIDDADDSYVEDNEFADIMTAFLSCMKGAAESGGLYCDSVKSREISERSRTER